MPVYRATVDTYVDRVLHSAGSVFATTQTPSVTWQIVESEEGEQSPSEPEQAAEQGMTYQQIKDRLTELGIPHKANDPKRKLLQLLPDPETYKEAAARDRAQLPVSTIITS